MKTIKEFNEMIDYIKTASAKKFDYSYFIYLSKDLQHGYLDKLLLPHVNIDFVLPIGICYEKRNGWQDFYLESFGF